MIGYSRTSDREIMLTYGILYCRTIPFVPNVSMPSQCMSSVSNCELPDDGDTWIAVNQWYIPGEMPKWHSTQWRHNLTNLYGTIIRLCCCHRINFNGLQLSASANKPCQFIVLHRVFIWLISLSQRPTIDIGNVQGSESMGWWQWRLNTDDIRWS